MRSGCARRCLSPAWTPRDGASRRWGTAYAPGAGRAADQRAGAPSIDRAAARSARADPGRRRHGAGGARQVGSQGCVILPEGGGKLGFVPSKVVPDLPDAKTTPWPMGDLVSTQSPVGVDAAKLQAALAAAFMPDDALTQAFVVTWKGRIIGERYGEGITAQTPLEVGRWEKA